MAIKLPKIKQLKKFLSLAQERQLIYLKRSSGGKWPWTKNPIFLKYKFCNTYREQDRVTVWIRDHWREPYKDHPNLWFAMCIARQLNWPDTLEATGFPETWNPKKVLKVLKQRMKDHEKTFTSAYLLGGGNSFGISKAEFIVTKVLDPVWKAFNLTFSETVSKHWVPNTHPKFALCDYPAPGSVTVIPSLKDTWEWLCQFHGWGKFLSYEVVTDLRHTRYLSKATDIHTWANIGPGARRGLNRLYERDLNATGQPDEKLLEELLLVNTWVNHNKDNKILPTWEPRDTEHWLCENDKYWRAEERIKLGTIVGLERFNAQGLI